LTERHGKREGEKRGVFRKRRAVGEEKGLYFDALQKPVKGTVTKSRLLGKKGEKIGNVGGGKSKEKKKEGKAQEKQ